MREFFSRNPNIFPLLSVVVITILMFGFAGLGLYSYQRNIKMEHTLREDAKQIENLTQEIKAFRKALLPEKINDWHFYVDNEMGFKILYPRDWSVEKSIWGGLPAISFGPTALAHAARHAVSIGVRFGPCIPDGHETYMNQSSFAINVAYRLHTKEKATTLSGLEGIRATWLDRTWDEDFALRSALPTTIFENCQESGEASKVLLIVVGDKDYLDIYNAMVRTFEFE